MSQTLAVNIVEAKDLASVHANGSDPLVIARHGPNIVHKTHPKKHTTAPAWNERFTIQVPVPAVGDVLFEVQSHESLKKDEHLGTCILPIASISTPNVLTDIWLPLSGAVSGSLHLHVTLENPNALVAIPVAPAPAPIATTSAPAQTCYASTAPAPAYPSLVVQPQQNPPAYQYNTSAPQPAQQQYIPPIVPLPSAPPSTSYYQPHLGHFSRTKFFSDVKSDIGTAQRDYIIIIDMSGSMAGERWHEAKQALHHLAPFCCKADPEGITMYFFSNSYIKFENVRHPHEVEKHFKSESPRGSTDMAAVLNSAFTTHFRSPARKTSILVITDGEPNSTQQVKDCLVAAGDQIRVPGELTITFIQVGDDPDASAFLHDIRDNLGANVPFVDVVTEHVFDGTPLSVVIQRALSGH